MRSRLGRQEEETARFLFYPELNFAELCWQRISFNQSRVNAVLRAWSKENTGVCPFSPVSRLLHIDLW